MSVGHTARVLEEAGVSTVAIYIRAFRHHAVNLKVPRVLVTPHLLGRTVGRPRDTQGQRRVVREALRVLERAEAPGTIVDFQEW